MKWAKVLGFVGFILRFFATGGIFSQSILTLFEYFFIFWLLMKLALIAAVLLSVLAMVPGPGFKSIFSDLEAAACLEYADQLPSTGEIVEVLEGMESDNVGHAK